MYVAKIWIGIESRLEFLCIDLSILIENMRVYLGDHVNFGIPRISLRCFQISVVEFQFVGCAGVAEGMKYYPG